MTFQKIMKLMLVLNIAVYTISIIMHKHRIQAIKENTALTEDLKVSWNRLGTLVQQHHRLIDSSVKAHDSIIRQLRNQVVYLKARKGCQL